MKFIPCCTDGSRGVLWDYFNNSVKNEIKRREKEKEKKRMEKEKIRKRGNKGFKSKIRRKKTRDKIRKNIRFEGVLRHERKTTGLGSVCGHHSAPMGKID